MIFFKGEGERLGESTAYTLKWHSSTSHNQGHFHPISHWVWIPLKALILATFNFYLLCLASIDTKLKYSCTFSPPHTPTPKSMIPKGCVGVCRGMGKGYAREPGPWEEVERRGWSPPGPGGTAVAEKSSWSPSLGFSPTFVFKCQHLNSILSQDDTHTPSELNVVQTIMSTALI